MRNNTHVVIMAAIPAVEISPDGEYLALSAADGTLKVWETSTGNLNQEYVPSSHLSATCTCLSWGPRRGTRESPRKRKKKRKSSVGEAVDNLDLIAMGTLSGDIIMYSVVKADLHTQLTGGHTDEVNGVCWCDDGSSLYSCSNDRFITHWCLSTSTVKEKWKADKNPVYSIALLPDQRTLLSASREIKLWDLTTKQVIKKLTGHATEVRWLVPVRSSLDGAGDASSLQTYFLSAAVEDRRISVWQANAVSVSKSALASFSLVEEPAYIKIWPPKMEGMPFLLLVVTKSGMLQIFEHILNGRLKKPVSCSASIQIAADCPGSTPRPFPILCAHMCECAGQDPEILLSYGNSLKPVFEKKLYSSLEKETFLVRKDTSRVPLKQSSEAVAKIKIPEVSNELTVIAPGHMTPSVPSVSTSDDKKTKRKRRKSIELTIEERLDAIGIDKPSSEFSGKQPPKTDTLATLLSQGLQSQDKKILNHVLQNTNETIIHNSVRKLPISDVVPLIQELSRRMDGHAQSGLTVAKWMKSVLTCHTAHLQTFPKLVDSLSSMYSTIDHRVSSYTKMSKLRGRLKLVSAQMQAPPQEEDISSQQPLLVYQDESSDDEFNMEALLQDHSESEDNWEDMSDMEVANGKDDEDDSESDMQVNEDSASDTSDEG